MSSIETIQRPLTLRGQRWSPVRKRFWRVVQAWFQRYRTRRHLLDLDDAALKDIGLERETALREAKRPFWASSLRLCKSGRV